MRTIHINKQLIYHTVSLHESQIVAIYFYMYSLSRELINWSDDP